MPGRPGLAAQPGQVGEQRAGLARRSAPRRSAPRRREWAVVLAASAVPATSAGRALGRRTRRALIIGHGTVSFPGPAAPTGGGRARSSFSISICLHNKLDGARELCEFA